MNVVFLSNNKKKKYIYIYIYIYLSILQQIFRDRYKNRKNRDNCEVKVNLNK